MIAQRCGKCDKPHTGPARPGQQVTGQPCLGHAAVKDANGDKIRNADGSPQYRPCRRHAERGATKCGAHGGRAPASRAAAAQRLADRKAEQIMRRFGEPVDTSPTEALLDAVRWTAGYVAWLRDKVAALQTDEEVVWGVTREVDDAVVVGNGPDAYVEQVTKQTREATPNAWVSLLGEWHDRLVRICAEAIKAGVEERRVRLAEQQGRLLADVIRGILADLNLTADQEAKVPDVVPRHLRAVAN